MSLTMRGDNGKRVELEQYVSTLMSACIDYRNLLIRAKVPDSVSGRDQGVEKIFQRFGVTVTPRSEYGESPLVTATLERKDI